MDKKKKSIKSTGVNVTLEELIECRYAARSIDLNGERRVKTNMAGNYFSSFRGRGMDFSEVRIYQPGDDVRHMDWRVNARTNKPHVKLYQEERERPVFILVDFSSTMYFGTRKVFKSVAAAKAAATIAWAAANVGHRVGGVVCLGEKTTDIKPQSGQRGVLPLLDVLSDASCNPQQMTNSESFANAILRLRRLVRPGSLIFIFSDFYHFDKNATKHISLLAQHNDVIPVFVYDELEKNPPPPDRYAVTNGDQVMTIDTHLKKFCENYRLHYQQRLEQVKKAFAKRQVSLLSLATDQSISNILGANKLI